MSWNESFTDSNAIEKYCIDSSDVPECSMCINPNTTFVCHPIMQNRNTSLSLRAVNCGNQQGENVSVTVNPQGIL